MATLWKCVAVPSGNPPGPPHAARMPHTTHAGEDSPRDKMDAPAACAVPLRPHCGGVLTRTRNVSEYMLVLYLCLVRLVADSLHDKLYNKIHNESTTNRKLYNQSATNPQQIYNGSNSRTIESHQVRNIPQNPTVRCATNPQPIEQVEIILLQQLRFV